MRQKKTNHNEGTSIFRIAELARRIGVSRQFGVHLFRGVARTEKHRKALYNEIVKELRNQFPEYHK